MGDCGFFPRELSAGQLLNHYFDCAKYWRINPLEMLDEPFSVLGLFAEQANRIIQENKNG
ncbi:hypothetical protein BWD41_10470 [Citrobacter braakii]|uniref:Uncharacterized protein n=1 Tax=Citrobacter braakii TaxID=57706 RepID=A0AA44RI11_CITBR|nr:hypothetical protein BWD41_10470 [Citrobacter braakii]TCC46287.1 hypothetical protein EY918_25040 [Citrobacter braakii]TKU45545.1 hypothetical protein FDX24_00350 [Citrobacter sp. wls716]